MRTGYPILSSRKKSPSGRRLSETERSAGFSFMSWIFPSACGLPLRGATRSPRQDRQVQSSGRTWRFFQLGNLVAFQGNCSPDSPLAAGGRGTVTDRYFVRSRKGGRDDRFPGGRVKDKLPLSPRSRDATEAVFRKCDRPALMQLPYRAPVPRVTGYVREGHFYGRRSVLHVRTTEADGSSLACRGRLPVSVLCIARSQTPRRPLTICRLRAS